MNLFEKLVQCSVGMNKSHLAQSVGLPANAISSYVAKRSIPRADIALKLARALGVSMEWLIDDLQGWPPSKVNQLSLSEVSDDDLLFELAKRQRLAWIEFIRTVNWAKDFDWKKAAAELRATPDGAPLSTQVLNARALAKKIETTHRYALCQYDLQQFIALRHAELPGSNVDPAVFERAERSFTFGEFQEREDFAAFADELNKRADWLDSQERKSLNEDRKKWDRNFEMGVEPAHPPKALETKTLRKHRGKSTPQKG